MSLNDFCDYLEKFVSFRSYINVICCVLANECIQDCMYSIVYFQTFAIEFMYNEFYHYYQAVLVTALAFTHEIVMELITGISI